MNQFCNCACHIYLATVPRVVNNPCPPLNGPLLPNPGVQKEGCCCYCARPNNNGNGNNPNRPTKNNGTDRGELGDGTMLTPRDLAKDYPPDSWAGPRKDMFLPYLFMRANPGDVGARPVVGPFWESPDILLLAGVTPALAPAIPPELGQNALANQPNTLYAHVWNFGQAQAPEVVVEFYWCDPSLGFNASSAHLIGMTVVSLGARGSGRSHAVVKCPEAWYPTFLNGGHECLLVRVWDYTSDTLGKPEWDASLNRHIGQRNIHVVPSGAELPIMHMTNAKFMEPATVKGLNSPILLKVGPLYGMSAQVAVTRVAPHNMPWLQLYTGERGKFPTQALPTGSPALTPPNTIGNGMSPHGVSDQHIVNGDDQQIGFTTGDEPPAKGEAHVYRVIASQGTQIIGGYTVVLAG